MENHLTYVVMILHITIGSFRKHKTKNINQLEINET